MINICDDIIGGGKYCMPVVWVARAGWGIGRSCKGSPAIEGGPRRYCSAWPWRWRAWPRPGRDRGREGSEGPMYSTVGLPSLLGDVGDMEGQASRQDGRA